MYFLCIPNEVPQTGKEQRQDYYESFGPNHLLTSRCRDSVCRVELATFIYCARCLIDLISNRAMEHEKANIYIFLSPLIR